MSNYIISITDDFHSKEAVVAIFNMSGGAQMHFGLGHTSFWIIPNSNKNREETIAQLEAVPGLQSIYVVTLSNPVKKEEVLEVREMMKAFSIDTSAVKDALFSSYLNSILNNKPTYYLDFDNELFRFGQTKLSIKVLEDHPDFSPEWLQPYPCEDIGREFTVDDFVTESETFEDIIEEEDEVEPPGPDLNDQKQCN